MLIQILIKNKLILIQNDNININYFSRFAYLEPFWLKILTVFLRGFSLYFIFYHLGYFYERSHKDDDFPKKTMISPSKTDKF